MYFDLEGMEIYTELRKKGLTTYEIYQLMIGYNMITEVLKKHGMSESFIKLFEQGENYDTTD